MSGIGVTAQDQGPGANAGRWASSRGGERWRQGAACVIGLICVVVSATPALGASSDPEALFRAGLEDMQAGRYESACPKLAESHRLDPLPGVLFTLAECEAAWGKLATAIDHYESFVSALTTLPHERRASFDERHSIALEKLAALSALAPEIVVDVALAAPAELIVKRNGVVVARESYSVSKRVDPGEYTITAELDGELVWQRRYVLQERDRARITIPWERRTEASSPVGAPPERRLTSTPASAADDRGQAPGGVYVLGSIGVAGIAGGLVAGSLAWSEKATIEENCPGRVCNEEGRAAVDSAQSSAAVGTVCFSVGVAAVAVAAVWWMLSEPDDERGASLSSLRPGVLVDDRGAAVVLGGAL